MIALHMGGVPELALVLGPILLIFVFVRIARRHEADLPDDDHDEDEAWDADLGDLPDTRHTTRHSTHTTRHSTHSSSTHDSRNDSRHESGQQ